MVTSKGILTRSIMNTTTSNHNNRQLQAHSQLMTAVSVSTPSQITSQHPHQQHTVSSTSASQQQQQAYPTSIPPAMSMSSTVMGGMSSLSPPNPQQQNNFRRTSVASSITTATLDDDQMATPMSAPGNGNNLYGPGPTSMGLDIGMLGAGDGNMNGLLGGIGSRMGSSSGSLQQQVIASSSQINMANIPTMSNFNPMSTASFPNLPLPNIPISIPTLTSINMSSSLSPHPGHPVHSHPGHSHSQHSQHSSSQKPIRRRMRMITSCLECRRRKLKCNKCKPCVNCQKFNRECLYLGPKLDEASQMRLTEIKEQVGSLERALERDVAKGAASSSHRGGGGYGAFGGMGMGMGSVRRGSCVSVGWGDGKKGGGREDDDSGSEEEDEDRDEEDDGQRAERRRRRRERERERGEYGEEEEDVGFTPLVTNDVTYDECETDDLIDLGIQVGKMRITERIGGMSRPRLAEEISVGIGSPRMGTNSSTSTSNGVDTNMTTANHLIHQQPTTVIDQYGNVTEHVPDFLRPSAAYIPPTSGFFFGQIGDSPSLIDFLPPDKLIGDRLVARYFRAVHPIARCVHRQSFEQLYEMFWLDVLANYEPRASVQAVVFAAWFSACVSLDEEEVQRDYGFTKAQLLENMKIGTESALARANFLRTTKVETLQAFVMYMIPLCREEVSRAHSVLVGAAVRMAECMGLHRDGEAFGLNPLETHVRRLIWHQLCFLDIRTCEAQGPKPAIRRDDYDTRLPLNCEEDGFINHHPGYPVVAQDHQWTSSLLTIMRFEVNEMMRIIWSDRRKLEARKMELTPVIAKISKFRERMLEKYTPLLDEAIPIQRYTKYVMNLLIYRLHAMVLHPYHSNTAHPLPERLNGLLIESGVLIIEYSIALESSPEFRDWAWYLGAYQQYQIALLLATEIYYRPNNEKADRIWACLDWVFQLESDMPRQEKSLRILTEIMSKTGVYTGMRKMRAPTNLVRAVPGKQAIKESPPPQTPMMGTSTMGTGQSGQGQSCEQVQQQALQQHAQQQQQQQAQQQAQAQVQAQQAAQQQAQQVIQQAQVQQQAQAQQQAQQQSLQQAQVQHHQQMMIQQQQQPLVLKQEPGLQTPTMPPSSSMSMSTAAAMASINTLSLPPSMNGTLSPAEHHHQQQLLLMHQHQVQVHHAQAHVQAAQHSQHPHQQHQHHPGQQPSHLPSQQQLPQLPSQHQGQHPHVNTHQQQPQQWHSHQNQWQSNMPPPNMVYAGVSDGAVLWGLPPGNNPGSPENSSDGGSVVNVNHQHGVQQGGRNGSVAVPSGSTNNNNGSGSGAPGDVRGVGGNGGGEGNAAVGGSAVGGGASGGAGRGGTMSAVAVGRMDVDWNLIESFFPTHPETGAPSFPAFAEPVISFVDGVPVPTMPPQAVQAVQQQQQPGGQTQQAMTVRGQGQGGQQGLKGDE